MGATYKILYGAPDCQKLLNLHMIPTNTANGGYLRTHHYNYWQVINGGYLSVPASLIATNIQIYTIYPTYTANEGPHHVVVMSY